MNYIDKPALIDRIKELMTQCSDDIQWASNRIVDNRGCVTELASDIIKNHAQSMVLDILRIEIQDGDFDVE